jgi:hypothetical protein
MRGDGYGVLDDRLRGPGEVLHSIQTAVDRRGVFLDETEGFG